eukprot:TRINITY_DN3219_c0_g1_i1.p1 TRINITY_DN3219_c0_g1~~TRINITY_DN3219_c0_g1_i1.p1  ORF type:complete len:863 (+),score=209.33 TRINITY_DN3219_c0_g1_i1:32-2590(+)
MTDGMDTEDMSKDEVMKILRHLLDKKGMSIDETCQRARQWAAEGKIVSAKSSKKLITQGVVESAIVSFLAEVGEGTHTGVQAAGVAQPEATADKENKEVPAPQIANTLPENTATALPSKKRKDEPEKQSAPRKRGKSEVPAAATETEAKAKVRKETAKERKQREKEEALARQAEEERLELERAAPFQGLSVEEMREKRMKEVLKEMDGRMADIVKRTAQSLGLEAPADDVLEKTLRGQASDQEGDSREAYMRLIHTVREDVNVPEGLQAELLPHQADGLEWLVSIYSNNLHGILADEMGLGKTIQSIALLQWLKEVKNNKGPHLVVAPKSTLTNWKAEFEKFAPTYKVWLLVGEQEERDALAGKLRKRIKDNKTTVYITNYEQIHRNDWLQQFCWQLIIIDEGHRMKNQNSVLHQTMTKMKCRTRMLLTGTPLQNNLNELWALLHYLLPDLFASSLDFQQWFLEPLRGVKDVNEYECSLRPEDEAELISRLHVMLSPFLLQRTKAQVMTQNLPPKVESVVRMELTAWQQAAYEDLQKRTVRLLTAADKVETHKVNNALMQLRKIVLHPYLFSGSQELGPDLFRVSGKVEVLDRMLRKLIRFGHKTLIFSQFTSVLDVLERYLQWKGLRFARLDGQTKHEERRAQILNFSREADLRVFLLSARAGGLGLNLQAADTVILFDLDWNPQNDKQAIARAHRYGQQNEVRVFRLLSLSGVERHMERRCQEKLDLERKIIGAGMFSKGASQEQRVDMLRGILGLTEGGNPQLAASNSGEVEGATTPDALNELLARSADELAAFRQMDTELLQTSSDAALQREELPFLVRCGRLMRPEEVPDGFRLEDDEGADGEGDAD